MAGADSMENAIKEGQANEDRCLPWVFAHAFERMRHGQIETALLHVDPEDDFRERACRLHGNLVHPDAKRRFLRQRMATEEQ